MGVGEKGSGTGWPMGGWKEIGGVQLECHHASLQGVAVTDEML